MILCLLAYSNGSTFHVDSKLAHKKQCDAQIYSAGRTPAEW